MLRVLLQRGGREALEKDNEVLLIQLIDLLTLGSNGISAILSAARFGRADGANVLKFNKYLKKACVRKCTRA